MCAARGLASIAASPPSSNETITVSPPWNVIPDAASTILLTFAVTNVAVYHNSLEAKAYAAAPDTHVASAGVQPYGNDYDFVVDGNTMRHMTSGISNWVLGQDRPKAVQPNDWMLFTHNQLLDGRVGISHLMGFYQNPGVDPGVASIGVVFRDNTITNPTVEGIALANAVWTSAGVPLDMMVFEKNTVLNAKIGVNCNASNLGNQITNTIFYKNRFDCGTTPRAGSRGSSSGRASFLPCNKISGRTSRPPMPAHYRAQCWNCPTARWRSAPHRTAAPCL